jgi:hypothetical protein
MNGINRPVLRVKENFTKGFFVVVFHEQMAEVNAERIRPVINRVAYAAFALLRGFIGNH